MAYADDIADKVPAPGKLGKAGPLPEADDEEIGNPEEADEDKAAAISQMQDVIDAVKKGDAEAACDAMDRYLVTAGFTRR